MNYSYSETLTVNWATSVTNLNNEVHGLINDKVLQIRIWYIRISLDGASILYLNQRQFNNKVPEVSAENSPHDW